MSLSYDVFQDVFFNKIREYDFVALEQFDRDDIVNGYMKRACARFNRICKYDLSKYDDLIREFDVDIPETDIDEIADIIATGMVAQWLQPYVYHQDNIMNALSTKDASVYSPAELSYRVREIYLMSQKDFKNMQYHYSYCHGDLTDLHL